MKNIFITILFVIITFQVGLADTFEEQNRDGLIEIQKGTEEHSKGCYKRALKYFYNAYQIFSLLDETETLSVTLNNIGNSYMAIDEYTKAHIFFDAAINNYEKMDDDKSASEVLKNKAIAEINLKNYDSAINLLQLAKAKNKENILIDNYIAKAYIEKNDYKKAEEILSSIYKKNEESAVINSNMGNLYIGKKEYEKALSFYEKALKKDKEENIYIGTAQDLYNIAKTHLALKNTSQSINFFLRSAKVYAILNNKTKVEEIINEIKKIESNNLNTEIDYFFIKLWTDENSIFNFCN